MTCILFLVFLLAFVRADSAEELKAHLQRSQQGKASSHAARFARSGVVHPNKQWPNKTIPVAFDSIFPNASRNIFMIAARHIMSRTCLKFISRTNEIDFIFVTTEGTQCRSYVGRQGKLQDLVLSAECLPELRSHLHEILHSIGFYHEHQRSDRDQYVTIDEENIIDVDNSKAINFQKLSGNCKSLYGVPYDYNSVMHYGRISGSRDHFSETIVPMDPDVKIGENYHLSEFDVKKINRMYCPGTIGIRIQNVGNGKYLRNRNDADTKKPVVTSKWTGEDDQKWTVHYENLQRALVGSSILTWKYGAFPIEGLAYVDQGNFSGYVRVEEYTEGDYQRWWMRIRNDTSWQIFNWRDFLCLTFQEPYSLRTGTCNESDPRQLWNIFNA